MTHYWHAEVRSLVVPWISGIALSTSPGKSFLMPRTSGSRLLLAAFLCTAFVACSDSTSADGDSIAVTKAPPAAAVPGWPLHDTIQIRLVDGADAGKAGIPVQWSVSKGGGTVTPLGETTDADGIAAALWTLGPAPGINELQVSGGGLAASLQTVGRAFQAERVDAGYGLGCGLVTGALWCWGKDSWVHSAPASDRPDPFGYDTTTSPGLVDDAHGWIDLAVSDDAVCVLDAQAMTWCADADHPTLAAVPGLPAVRFITRASTGNVRFCGLTVADSTAWCWGDASAAPTVPGSSGLALMHMGFSGAPFACGLRADGAAVCWGPGPLGDGTTASSTSPVVVSGDLQFYDVAVGDGFACGLTGAGDVWCWGKDWEDGLAGPPDVLVPALAISGASQIAANDNFAIALTGDGVVVWQGAGFDAAPVPGFTDISGLDGLTVAAFALNSNTCLQLDDGQVYCWDEMWDRSSRLNYGLYTPVQPVP